MQTKHVRFFAAHSRLGMINLPYGEKELNLGVEHGPGSVLTDKYVATFAAGTQVTSFTFPLPESIKQDDYPQVIAESHRALADLINRELKIGETQVVVGGDHGVALSSLRAVLERVPADQVGYIQFDTHGDVHTFATSPSGNFHGMWMRPFLSAFDHPLIERLAPHKLASDQVLFVGNLDLEPEEQALFHDYQIKNITRQDLLSKKSESLTQIDFFLQRFAHLHVSFDIDVFDQAVAPATGTPSRNGLFWDEVEPILEMIAKHKMLSIDLVEVNPKKVGAEVTIKLAQQVLTKLLW